MSGPPPQPPGPSGATRALPPATLESNRGTRPAGKPPALLYGVATHLWGEGKDVFSDVVELGGAQDAHVPVGPPRQAHLLVATWGKRRFYGIFPEPSD